MEGRPAVWFLLLEALICAGAQNTPKYLEVGHKLELTPEPKPVPGSINSITWKFNGGIVGEFNAETLPLEYSKAYEGRASVDTTTGVLEISNMMKSDSGLYTVDINDKVQPGGHDVRVIEQLPDPKAVMRPLVCNRQSESCWLDCDGDITEAGPVTFYLKKGDGDWEEGEQRNNIINDEASQAIPTFSCRMKNPLGQKDSKPVDNMLYVGSNTGAIVGSIFGVLIALVGAGVGVFFWKKRKDSDTTDPATADSPRENGDKQEGEPLKNMSPGTTPDSKEDV